MQVRVGDSPIWMAIRPYLDGRPAYGCIEADTEAGRLICYRKDEAGRYVVDPETHDLVTEERHGRVELARIAGADHATVAHLPEVTDEDWRAGKPLRPDGTDG